MPLYSQNGKLIQKAEALGTSAGCCCGECSDECCRTRTYTYGDTVPPGKWFDECPDVGNCAGTVIGDCADVVIEGYIIERFCKKSIEGLEIRAILRANSSLDDFGTIAGIDTTEVCGVLGVIVGDHDITSELEFEDDGAYLLAKVPIRIENSPTLGGPVGASNVVICWCCVDPEDPPVPPDVCPCCEGPPPPPPSDCCCIGGVMYSGYTPEACSEAGGEFFSGAIPGGESRCTMPTCDPPCGSREYCNDGSCIKPDVLVEWEGLFVSNTSVSGTPPSAASFDDGGFFGGYLYGLATEPETSKILNPGYKFYTSCNDYCIEVLVYVANTWNQRTYRCRVCFLDGESATCELIAETIGDPGEPIPSEPTVTVDWAP